MKTLRIAVTAALAALATAASAQTATGTFNVSATVAATCRVTSPATTTLAFGAYDPAAAGAAVGSLTMNFRCTRGTAWEVTLSTGANGPSATGTTRAMAGAGDFLNYELYRNAARTEVWSPTVGGNTVSGVGVGNAPGGDNVTIYGGIPAGQFPAPGSYSDTVTLTVNY